MQTNAPCARDCTACLTQRLPACRGSSKFFLGAALYQQWNEIAQSALVEACIRALYYRHNVIVWKVRVLSGKTALHRVDSRPLFSRHVRNHRHLMRAPRRRSDKMNRPFTDSKTIDSQSASAGSPSWPGESGKPMMGSPPA
jgi:hypothetical protein